MTAPLVGSDALGSPCLLRAKHRQPAGNLTGIALANIREASP